jgi:hypothetical protein
MYQDVKQHVPRRKTLLVGVLTVGKRKAEPKDSSVQIGRLYMPDKASGNDINDMNDNNDNNDKVSVAMMTTMIAETSNSLSFTADPTWSPSPQSYHGAGLRNRVA